MTRVRIGVKYCGGCNPRYERVEMIERVRSSTGDRLSLIRHDQENLDGLITVNGCPRACGTKGLNSPGVPHHSVTDKADFDGLIEWLFRFDQSGTKGVSI
jgi:hypothetical protein